MPIRRVLLAMVLSALPGIALAQSDCVVDKVDAAASIVGGIVLFQSEKGRLLLRGCDEAQLVGGKVITRHFSERGVVEVNEFDKAGVRFGDQLKFHKVKSLLQLLSISLQGSGAKSQMIQGRQFDTASKCPNGLPCGTLLLASQFLTVDLSGMPGTAEREFFVTDPGSTNAIRFSSAGTGVHRAAASAFRAGPVYRFSVREQGRETHQGGFDIADAETGKRIEERVKRAQGASANDPLAMQLARLDVLRSAGFHFDADQLSRRIVDSLGR